MVHSTQRGLEKPMLNAMDAIAEYPDPKARKINTKNRLRGAER
jgi:hypothetical protein